MSEDNPRGKPRASRVIVAAEPAQHIPGNVQAFYVPVHFVEHAAVRVGFQPFVRESDTARYAEREVWRGLQRRAQLILIGETSARRLPLIVGSNVIE